MTGYRWVVLAVFCVITAVMQMQWLTFAPIARDARAMYGVSGFAIDLLSLVFMVVFLIGSIPVAWLLDARGVRFGVRVGATLTAVFGLLKGVFAGSYALVFVAQVGLAIAQPFVLNATTKLASDWFPSTERALAVGLATLSQFVGIVIVMIATPLVLEGSPEPPATIQLTLLGYGMIAVLSAIAVFVWLDEAPRDAHAQDRDSPCPRLTVRQGLVHVFTQRDMRLVLLMFFLGLGMFNAISTCIDAICEQKGLSIDQSGLVGGIMLIAGIVGGIALPLLSDRARKRKPFLIACMVCTVPGVVGLAMSHDFNVLLASSFVIGFFLLGGGAPIGFQYAAEVSHPIPETVAQGVILMSGQLSGIAMIVGMNLFGMLPSLWFHVACAVVIAGITTLLRESPLILVDGQARRVLGDRAHDV